MVALLFTLAAAASTLLFFIDNDGTQPDQAWIERSRKLL